MTLSQIMIEAHARAREDFAFARTMKGVHFVRHPYSYYLGLQMRSGFAEKRRLETGIVMSAPLGQDRWC